MSPGGVVAGFARKREQIRLEDRRLARARRGCRTGTGTYRETVRARRRARRRRSPAFPTRRESAKYVSGIADQIGNPLDVQHAAGERRLQRIRGIAGLGRPLDEPEQHQPCADVRRARLQVLDEEEIEETPEQRLRERRDVRAILRRQAAERRAGRLQRRRDRVDRSQQTRGCFERVPRPR